MTARRRFRFDVVKETGNGPEFELAGVPFRCASALPARAHIALDNAPSATVAAAAFIAACLATDADAQRFDDLLRSRDVLITGVELGAVLEWLSGEYARREDSDADPSPAP